MTRQAPMIGISLKLASTLAFFVMVTALKIAADRVPIGELVFARNFFGLFPVLIMVGLRRELALAFKTVNPGRHLTRAAVGLTAMVCGFTSFHLLPLPDATALGFATPLMVVVFAFFLLGEPVRIYRWSAVIVGFLGILVVLSPHLGETHFDNDTTVGAIVGLIGACFAALAMITVRKLCETERTSTIVTWFSGAATVMALLTLPLGWVLPGQAWVMPDLETGLLLVAVGLFGGIGQILLTQSYRFAEASTIAPFDYVNMLWAILIGWVVFAEVPVAEVIAGSVIVIAAGVFVIYREHRLGLDRTKDRRASSPSKS
ncbi:DMT family transporter [Roseibium denhamense]|uniref:Permease of the drug/metabolite transporter (DMT) superfamily n=2 Tax=Roseibium denhamense TaxID=76305 RepID=A0ABY1N8R3_9HYPH|nr:DMT family transporter [Roseibium denhamense]SMP03465.1 Permease of the drug/metabolite transporter (DMT) superfamily [Roseibium denhamense]